MNIRKQIVVDKYIAKPIAYFLNFIVRIAGQLFAIDHSLNKEFKTIAICKFKGMGSIIQSTPMLYAIRKRYPQAQIIFVSTKANKKLLEKINWIDTVITVDESSLFRFITSNTRALFTLIKARPEVYFDLEIYSDYSTLFTLATFSTNRIGFYIRSSSFRMGIYTHMMFFNSRVPIANIYLQLAKLLGCETENTMLYPLSAVNSAPLKPAKEYIIINPNASDLRLERRWDKNNFIELIHSILINFQTLDIVLIGSKAEQVYTQEIAAEIKDERVKNTAGATSIDELITIIANAKLMVSNDTGPVHIAYCTKTPVICLFGPCSPEQYGVNPYSHIIYKRVYCSPCVHDFEIAPCKGNNVCMKLITTHEVVEKVKQLINNKHSIDQQLIIPTFIYKKEEDVLGKVYR